MDHRMCYISAMETDVLREALAEPPTADELAPLPDEEHLRLRRDNETLRAENARLQAEVIGLRRDLLAAEEDFAERLTQLLNRSLLQLRELAASAACGCENDGAAAAVASTSAPVDAPAPDPLPA
jgi:uncharacterized protein YlxW (UPF0749 family)